MENDVLSFGDLKFYRLSSGQYIPVYDPELRKNLHDWCSIEPTDFENTVEDDDDDDNA